MAFVSTAALFLVRAPRAAGTEAPVLLLGLHVRPTRGSAFGMLTFVQAMKQPNNAMHTDFAMALRFHIGDHWRGAGDGDRSPTMRAERAKLKSRRDDMT